MRPLLDPEKFGSLYIPETARDDRSIQGIVVAAGPESDFALGDWVFYRHYLGADETFFWHGTEYLQVPDKLIVGRLVDKVFIPRKREVVIAPVWDNLGESKRAFGIIAVDPTVFNFAKPPRSGTVIYLGENCREVSLGDHVLLPPLGGIDLALIDRVIYVIPEADLLAILPNAITQDSGNQSQ